MNFTSVILWTAGPLTGTTQVVTGQHCRDRMTLAEAVSFIDFMDMVGGSWTRQDFGRYTVLAMTPVWGELLPG